MIIVSIDWHTLTHLFSVYSLSLGLYTFETPTIYSWLLWGWTTTGDEKQKSRRNWLRLPQSLRNRRAWTNSWTCFPRRFKFVVFWIQKLMKRIFLPRKCQRALPWADCSWWAAESRSCWLRFGCWNLESGWNGKNLEGIRRFSVGKHVS